MNNKLTALLAALAVGIRQEPEPTPEEIRAFRASCRNADMLELGQLLFESRHAVLSAIVEEEIRKRGIV